jgi:phenylalanyl-tRNA synthetase alpha subunit
MTSRTDRRGWAFELGLERIAVILFEIPYILMVTMVNVDGVL